jgi:DNA modification methylase
MIKTLHPFPARMAPEIALRSIEALPIGSVVCDPMSGSGTVAAASQSLGMRAYAYDIDPLAYLLTAVRCAKPEAVERALKLADEFVKFADGKTDVALPWMDRCTETSDYVKYWFGKRQILPLRRAARFLAYGSRCKGDMDAANILRLALSRLIVRKSNGASLAWDVSHSRPHRVYESRTYKYDVVRELQISLVTVFEQLYSRSVKSACIPRLGDARQLHGLKRSTVDAIVTSPPYLNAIDYMRGHRLSLVWLGLKIPYLRSLRTASVGSEARGADVKPADRSDQAAVLASYPQHHVCQPDKAMIARYSSDLLHLTRKAAQVLKPRGTATYVIGDNVARGIELRNSQALVRALELSGFEISSIQTREIPAHHRYLPVKVDAKNALANRMREEVVIVARRLES